MGTAHVAFKRFENHLIVVSDAHPPTADEWSRYLQGVVELDRDLAGLSRGSAVVFTDGGGPDSAQRVALRKVMVGRSAPTAMISDALGLRAAIGIIGLINKEIRGFPSSEWKQGLRFAMIDDAKHLEVMRVAVSLSHEVTECRVLRAIGT